MTAPAKPTAAQDPLEHIYAQGLRAAAPLDPMSAETAHRIAPMTSSALAEQNSGTEEKQPAA